MMFKAVWQLCVFSIIADCALCSPSHLQVPRVVKDFHSPPTKWHKIGPAPAEHVINLQIGLKQSRFDELERKLFEGNLDTF
jgi:tripeptidyl-peptidase I